MIVPNLSDVASSTFHAYPAEIAALRQVCDETDRLRDSFGEDDPRVQAGEVHANNLKGAFTRKIAWACHQHDPRFGLRRKTTGQLATRPSDGLTHSTDALMWRDTGNIVDVMSDRDVSWIQKDDDTQPLDQWVEPLPEGTPAPPPVDPPKPDPPPVVDSQLDARVARIEQQLAEQARTNANALKALSDRVQVLVDTPATQPSPFVLPSLEAVGKIRMFGFSYDLRLPVQKKS